MLTIYYQLFYFLVDEGIRDPFNNSHVTALHYVYQPKLINEKLELWRNAWSKHRIRTVRSSPIHLWVSGQLLNPVGIDLYRGELDCYGVAAPVTLSNHCSQILRSQIPTKWTLELMYI